jgi:hypothetical protein
MGHVPDLLVSPHFSQPNSFEFDGALKWRTSRAVEHNLRQEMRDAHTCQLFTVMKKSLEVSLPNCYPCS